MPGECLGQWSLAGYDPWGGKESDTTKATYRACSTRHPPLVAPEGAGEDQVRPPGPGGILPVGIANDLSLGHAGLRVHCWAGPVALVRGQTAASEGKQRRWMSHVHDNWGLQILDSRCFSDQLRTPVLVYLPDRMASVSSAIWNDVSVAFTDVNILGSLLHSPMQTRTGKRKRINTYNSQHWVEKHSIFVIIGGVQIPLKWGNLLSL